MRIAVLPALVWLLVANGGARADDPKMTPDESLLNAFQVMCFLGDPDFDRLDAKASAMHMKSLSDHPPPGPPGVSVKGHIWGGMLTTGPFVLHIYEQRVTNGVASSCGVSGNVQNADAFRDTMLRVMNLKLPSPTPGPQGQGYVWNDMPSRNHRLILRTGTAKAGPQVMVTYSVKEVH